MSFRLRSLFLAPVFFLCISGLRAQSTDFLKHRKFFDICSIKKQCSECYTCTEQRYVIKIKNTHDKQIKQIYYSFYSATFNQILEKEAKIQGNKIDVKETGSFYICVPDGRHWVVNRIVYNDDSYQSFILHERMENFLQEPDECDCND